MSSSPQQCAVQLPPPAYTPKDLPDYDEDQKSGSRWSMDSFDTVIGQEEKKDKDTDSTKRKSFYTTTQPRSSKRMTLSRVEGTQEWAHDLASGVHVDTSTCLTALFCPCIIFGRNSDRMDHLRKTGRAHPDPDAICCSDACVVYASCVPCCGIWKMQAELRDEVRQRYGIRQERSWVAGLCCALGLTQESREIRQEELGMILPGRS